MTRMDLIGTPTPNSTGPGDHAVIAETTSNRAARQRAALLSALASALADQPAPTLPRRCARRPPTALVRPAVHRPSPDGMVRAIRRQCDRLAGTLP